MTFERCTIKDLPLLQKISEKTYRDAFAGENTAEDMDAYIASAFNADTLRKSLENSASRYYFAMVGGSVVGYIKLNYAPAQTDLHDDDSIEVERIYVLREHQGKRYGNALLEKAVQEAQDSGKSYVWLGVWEKNTRAIRFYERNGFIKFGEHIFTLGTDPQTDHLMKKEL